jgi:predicted PurR-regulated permease PerM
MGTGNEQVYIWVLSGVLAFLLAIMTIVGTSVAKSIGEKLKELLESVNELVVLTTQQTEQIKTLFNNKEDTRETLDDHEQRLRDIEKNCKKC